MLSPLLLVVTALLDVGCSKSPPVWPQRYMVGGTFQLPYAELVEPFVAYIDKDIGASRIDYYGDVVQTFHLPDSTYGHVYMVAPMTTYDVLNQRTCFQTNGTKEDPILPQPALPDLAAFELISTGRYNDDDVEIWRNVTVIGQKKNVYTMYIEQFTNRPVRYEMHGYDSLLGSHYDKYYVEYYDFSAVFPASVFTVPEGVKCGGFPGPGVEHKAIANPMHIYINNYDEHTDSAFHSFKSRHGKTYSSLHEETQRKVNFKHNLRYIQSMNRAGHSYTLAVNHLADMTEDERRMLRGRHSSDTKNNGGRPFEMSHQDVVTAPDSVDWRLYGAVSQVKDQAACGSCWSFGTTGTIEGAYFLKTGSIIRLSQQMLVDCSWGEGNNGCDGGEDFRAYHWIMKTGGLATEEEYGQYEGIDGYCQPNATRTVQIKGFVNVTPGDLTALKVAIFKYGPISVGIDASHPSLSFYANGVYYEPACGNKPDDLDHAVLAVGYGELLGQKYWLIKNSWSTYWGNNGYVLMSQKDNNCGVATGPTYVIM